VRQHLCCSENNARVIWRSWRRSVGGCISADIRHGGGRNISTCHHSDIIFSAASALRLRAGSSARAISWYATRTKSAALAKRYARALAVLDATAARCAGARLCAAHIALASPYGGAYRGVSASLRRVYRCARKDGAPFLASFCGTCNIKRLYGQANNSGRIYLPRRHLAATFIWRRRSASRRARVMAAMRS